MSGSIPPESNEERIERERQRIRDEVARLRSKAQEPRNEFNAIIERYHGDKPDQYDQNKMNDLEREITALEAAADRQEMAIRDVK